MASIRSANSDDAPFLEHMFAIAVDWHANPLRPVGEIMGEPGLAKYVEGFPRSGDMGFVAYDEAKRLGAIWYRFFTQEEPSYGFVDESTPELVLGFVEEARGQGLGTQLLEHLIEAAAKENVEALSLSVDNANPAARLYQRLGFVTVEEKTSDTGHTHSTMVLKLKTVAR